MIATGLTRREFFAATIYANSEQPGISSNDVWRILGKKPDRMANEEEFRLAMCVQAVREADALIEALGFVAPKGSEVEW